MAPEPLDFSTVVENYPPEPLDFSTGVEKWIRPMALRLAEHGCLDGTRPTEKSIEPVAWTRPLGTVGGEQLVPRTLYVPDRQAPLANKELRIYSRRPRTAADGCAADASRLMFRKTSQCEWAPELLHLFVMPRSQAPARHRKTKLLRLASIDWSCSRYLNLTTCKRLLGHVVRDYRDHPPVLVDLDTTTPLTKSMRPGHEQDLALRRHDERYLLSTRVSYFLLRLSSLHHVCVLFMFVLP